ncbi:MAG: hypothetical protein GY774_16245 [Planctomycetes bacterium]|nr:hypothetical protein [Planctomycetota bacterium]
MSSDGGLYFGVGKDPDTASFFSGLIDDVLIYNDAPSAEEIEALVRKKTSRNRMGKVLKGLTA